MSTHWSTSSGNISCIMSGVTNTQKTYVFNTKQSPLRQLLKSNSVFTTWCKKRKKSRSAWQECSCLSHHSVKTVVRIYALWRLPGQSRWPQLTTQNILWPGFFIVLLIVLNQLLPLALKQLTIGHLFKNRPAMNLPVPAKGRDLTIHQWGYRK